MKDGRCMCELVKTAPYSTYKYGVRSLMVGRNRSRRWTSCNLTLNYKERSGKYYLFVQARGEDVSGFYQGITFCPWCGAQLNAIDGENTDDGVYVTDRVID